MDVTNLTGLEKPLEKLIEVFAEGLGETANVMFKLDARKIKRIGDAEAEVEKNKIIKLAEGKAESVEIFMRAGKRFALEQYTKQVNLENIFIGAKEALEGSTVSDQPVDKDWAFRFMNIAQDVSREDMQKILSKILAEEIKSPNSFSLRTLDFIKNLSKSDLLLFKKAAMISDDINIHISKINANEGFFNISYGDIMKMIEIGFIQSGLSTVLNFGDVEDSQVYSIFLKNKNNYSFKFIEKQKDITLPILQLTTIGRELSILIELEDDDNDLISQYIEELKKYWQTKKLEFMFIN